MCTALEPQANSGSPKRKRSGFWVVICRRLGRTSNQTRWANKQTSSKQDGQTSRKEKKKKEKKKEKKTHFQKILIFLTNLNDFIYLLAQFDATGGAFWDDFGALWRYFGATSG